VKDKQIGFIGCGKMAQAIISGMLNSNLISPNQISASAKSEATIQSVKNTYNIFASLNNEDITREADLLFLAVKPNLYTEIITEIKDVVKQDAIIITIASGITIQDVEESFNQKMKVIRTMPNTPSLVGQGMSAISYSNSVTTKELDLVVKLFGSFGRTEIIDEKLMDTIPAISGSSPAYVYIFIEALADGGVAQGIPRHIAYTLAAQAVLGAAKMVLETGNHPGMLKDNVCTPGGSTIEAISTLEKNNFRGSILKAMEDCTRKSILLGSKLTKPD
jgi:pyrroline-5-carboxylate reductase